MEAQNDHVEEEGISSGSNGAAARSLLFLVTDGTAEISAFDALQLEIGTCTSQQGYRCFDRVAISLVYSEQKKYFISSSNMMLNAI